MRPFFKTHASDPSLSILLSLSGVHFLNDLCQSVVSASYPVVRDQMGLSFGQIGLLSLVYQICASVFQPVFGVMFDRHPNTWYLVAGNLSTMAGLLVLGFSTTLWGVMAAVALIGLGSSVIHPEASRLTHFASEGRHGAAQSIFQVGGYLGGSIGPLLAAALVAPYGQRYIAVFAMVAFISLFARGPLVRWQRSTIQARNQGSVRRAVHRVRLSKRKIYMSLGVLLLLVFSKYAYMASLSSFYTFYLIDKFGVSTAKSQILLFAYLFASAIGTLLGGPIGDRVGRKWVIWVSILGAAPFALAMPYVGLGWTCVLSVVIGLVLSSAFSAILVYAQELLPTKVGLVSGFFFGFAFGIAGIAAAVLGGVADAHGIEYVYRLCAYIPLMGVVALLLPNVKAVRNG